ncbi:MAG: U32 family peptidase [Oscillospiraceae bacterium]|nr:U32 family peptidase [Oscillospiraceae bacterium]
MIEILAPCGGEDCLPAALNTGADAVYLGVTAFSARKNAKNFTFEQLDEALYQCRLSGVKVYVAMNTLIFDDELDEAVKTARILYEKGIDALIVQDMGFVRRLKKEVPDLTLHASTQMTVTSASGAEFARKQGFERVVLAREMSLREIEKVVRNVDIETEVFVHGALCVCVSGQCLMSAMYGGRSGNRGMCAQPCRLDFSCDGRHNVLSLKDLSIIEHLRELDRIGVTSAKIEGRMKRPEYVAAAVTACREALSGNMPNLEQLRSVFSRSGFTQSYYDGSIKDMQGIRTKDDVESSAAVLKEIRQLYDKPYKRHKVDIALEIHNSKPVTAAVKCGDIAFAYDGGVIPETARNRSLTAEDVCERMGKLGGTVFEAGKITCSIDEGLMIPASEINRFRREIIEIITEKLTKKEDNK